MTRFAAYVIAASPFGLSACSTPYDPAAVNWLVRLPRRSGRDLPLPKPSKGTTLCPQLPGILGSRWKSIGARIVLRDANVIADTGTSATFVKCRIPRSNYLGVREGAA